jgi:DNA-binding LacI/PurR family transcriptional regulator
MSGKGRIGYETKQRVFKLCNELNYRPNLIAKGLANSRTYNLGVVLPADSNLTEIPFFQSCLLGVCETAASMDYDVVVTTVTEDNISLLRRLIDNHKVDGVILTRSIIHDNAAGYLKQMEVPFVMVGSCQDDSVIQIDSNHLGGCEELTSVLIRSGCSHFAFIGGNQEHIVNRNRYFGFKKALELHQLNENVRLTFLDAMTKPFVDHAVDTIMQRRVDCIICTDDLICSRVLARLDQMKYSVPQDVKVASFYNSTFLESHNPPITALNINVKELGSMAGKRLIELLLHKEIPQKTLINYEILLKRSTGGRL